MEGLISLQRKRHRSRRTNRGKGALGILTVYRPFSELLTADALFAAGPDRVFYGSCGMGLVVGELSGAKNGVFDCNPVANLRGKKQSHEAWEMSVGCWGRGENMQGFQ